MKWNGRLPESELELMLAVWEAGEEGTTAPGILARLERPLTAQLPQAPGGKGLSELRQGGKDQPLPGQSVLGGV